MKVTQIAKILNKLNETMVGTEDVFSDDLSNIVTAGKTVLDYVENKKDFEFVDGFVELPRIAGLGVEVNKALVVEENQTPHNWKNPVWHHADGSVAEW